MADKLRPDELAAFKAAFDMFDKNQDGTISTKVSRKKDTLLCSERRGEWTLQKGQRSKTEHKSSFAFDVNYNMVCKCYGNVPKNLASNLFYSFLRTLHISFYI